MKLYIKQKVFTLKDRFSILDEEGNAKYKVEGKFISIGKKLHVYDLLGNEVSFISQKVLSLLPKFEITKPDGSRYIVRKKFTFFMPAYSVSDLDIDVDGNFFQHDYNIYKLGKKVATVHKEWISFGDYYTVDISDSSSEIDILNIVLSIDACLEIEDSSRHAN